MKARKKEKRTRERESGTRARSLRCEWCNCDSPRRLFRVSHVAGSIPVLVPVPVPGAARFSTASAARPLARRSRFIRSASPCSG